MTDHPNSAENADDVLDDDTAEEARKLLEDMDKVEDPQAVNRAKLDDYQRKVVELHDTLDTVKNVAEQLSDEIREAGKDVEDETRNDFFFLADTAMKAKNRVQVGDNQLLRNNL